MKAVKEGRTAGGNVTFVDDSAIQSVELKRTAQRESKILILDDNRQTLSRLARTLNNGRRRIIAVRESGSAIDILSTSGRSFDIVVADFNIRRDNPTSIKGDAVLEFAKQANPGVKTILVSGDPGDARKGAADKVIQKEPDQPETTLAMLRHTVSKMEKNSQVRAP